MVADFDEDRRMIFGGFTGHKYKERSYKLFAYTSTAEEYRAAIPGLLYSAHRVGLNDSPVEPAMYPLRLLLSEWSPNDNSPDKWAQSRAHPENNGNDDIKLSVSGRGASLNINISGLQRERDGSATGRKKRGRGGVIRLDYADAQQRALAEKYREAELPFVLYNVREVEAAADVFSISNLLNNFGSVPRIVERSKDNKFMYYTAKNPVGSSLQFPLWKPPQDEIMLTFAKYLKEAEGAERSGDIAGAAPLSYLTVQAAEGLNTPWIREALPIFSGHDSSWFSVDSSGFKGINCRFGMKGVIAAAHYDAGRNFVGMIRGRKRYVLLPPRECGKLDLYSRPHPSARHSSFDWADEEVTSQRAAFLSAVGTELVLSRGEVLYIPSFWFHYIISQDSSVQCNARSGLSTIGYEHIAKCGFDHKSKIGAAKGKADLDAVAPRRIDWSTLQT